MITDGRTDALTRVTLNAPPPFFVWRGHKNHIDEISGQPVVMPLKSCKNHVDLLKLIHLLTCFYLQHIQVRDNIISPSCLMSHLLFKLESTLSFLILASCRLWHLRLQGLRAAGFWPVFGSGELNTVSSPVLTSILPLRSRRTLVARGNERE